MKNFSSAIIMAAAPMPHVEQFNRPAGPARNLAVERREGANMAGAPSPDGERIDQESIMKQDILKATVRLGVGALCAALLAGCVVYLPQRPRPVPSAHADVVLATERGMRSIVFDARNGYLALSNTDKAPSMVLRTGAVVNRSAVWTPVELGPCALGPARGGEPLRSPALTRLDGKIFLYQPTFGSAKEHSLCQYERASEWFAPRDQGLRVCRGEAGSRRGLARPCVAGLPCKAGLPAGYQRAWTANGCG